MAGNRFTVTINSTDLSRARRAIMKAAEEKAGCPKKVIDAYKLRIAGTAKQNLLRDPKRWRTGQLANDIDAGIIPGIASLVEGVFNRLEYAPYVHWGTGIYGENPRGGHRMTPWVYYDESTGSFRVTQGMPPNPYLLDAFNQHKDALLRDLESCLKQRVSVL